MATTTLLIAWRSKMYCVNTHSEIIKPAIQKAIKEVEVIARQAILTVIMENKAEINAVTEVEITRYQNDHPSGDEHRQFSHDQLFKHWL